MHVRAGRSRADARLIRVSRKRGAMIGTQFSSLVKQFVSSFIDPLLSLVGGTPDLGIVGRGTPDEGYFGTR